jgi:hypothetical protein
MKQRSLTFIILFTVNILSLFKLDAMAESAISEFERLPLEMSEMIFENLNVKNLAFCMLVCSTWHKMALKKILNQLGPDNSYNFLLKHADRIIQQNRKMRSALRRNATDDSIQRTLNKKLRRTISKKHKNFQLKKWKIIQLLAQGAHLNARNKKKEYCIDIALKKEKNSTELAYFLLSLGSIIPDNRYACRTLSACNTMCRRTINSDEELTVYLDLLIGKVLPNFFASKNMSCFEKTCIDFTYYIKLYLGFIELFFNYGAANSLLSKKARRNMNDGNIGTSPNNIEALLNILQQLKIDLKKIFINTIERNPVKRQLEALFSRISFTPHELKDLMNQFEIVQDPDCTKAYDFLEKKFKQLSLN